MFFLLPEQAAVLANSEHPAFGMGMFHRLPQTMDALKLMPESFRTGMGRNYDSHGPEGAVGIERSFEPWNNAHLVGTVLPALDGVTNALSLAHKSSTSMWCRRRRVANGRAFPPAPSVAMTFRSMHSLVPQRN